MTVPAEAEDAPALTPGNGHDAPHALATRSAVRSARETVAAVCPYLVAADGSWRMSTPSRDHRCAAVGPPAPQTTDKQRRHCLSEDHARCTLFRAARDARTAMLAAGADPALVGIADGRRRRLARTAPVLLERPRLVDQAIRLRLDRGPGQIALILLMVVAFAVVALTRLSSASGEAAASAPIASQLAAVPSPTPTPTATPTPPAGPSVAPSASAAAARTYKVKRGDTLITVAKAFGTTAQKIKSLNALTASTLKPGQILQIP